MDAGGGVIQQDDAAASEHVDTAALAVAQEGSQPMDPAQVDKAIEEDERRREFLVRRPSYRRIFNGLSDDPTASVGELREPKIESTDESCSSQTDMSNSSLAVTAAQLAGIVNHAGSPVRGGDGDSPSLSLTGSVTSSPMGLVQYTTTRAADGTPLYIPVPGVSAGGMQAAYSLGNGAPPLMTAAPCGMPEEASRRREIRLLKNREAARECRRKKKEYVKCLENRVAVLENQNKALIEELKSLKELYCRQDS